MHPSSRPQSHGERYTATPQIEYGSNQYAPPSQGGGGTLVGPGGYVRAFCPAAPSAHSIQKNIRPRTRQERRNMTDKETLEKSRLREVGFCCRRNLIPTHSAQRKEGYHRYQDYGKSLTAQAPGTCGYVPGILFNALSSRVLHSNERSESERFVTDTAAEEKLLREQEAKRQASVILQKRDEVSTCDCSLVSTYRRFPLCVCPLSTSAERKPDGSEWKQWNEKKKKECKQCVTQAAKPVATRVVRHTIH